MYYINNKYVRRLIIVLLFLFLVGFSAVVTTLYGNFNIGFSPYSDDFDIYFSSAIIDGEDYSNEIISDDGKTIDFGIKELKNIGDSFKVEYDITNNSTQYDANINIKIDTNAEKYLSIVNDVEKTINAKSVISGNMIITLKKIPVEELNITIKSILEVEASERITIENSSLVASSEYSAFGYFVDKENNVIKNARLIVYSNNPQYIKTDAYGYFYVDGLEKGKHEIFYINNDIDYNSLTKEEIKNISIDSAIFTTTSKEINFNNGRKIIDATIREINNKIYDINLNYDNGSSNGVYEVIENHIYGDLPVPTKTGHTFIGWYVDGLLITSDIIVKGDKTHTLVAKYLVNKYNVSLMTSNGTSNVSNIEVDFGGVTTFTITPDNNYYLSSITCTNNYITSGYTTTFSSTGTQTVTLHNNSNATNSVCTVTFLPLIFNVTLTATGGTSNLTNVNVEYGKTTTFTVTPSTNYYLDTITCTNNYTVSGYTTGYNALTTQTVTLKSNNPTAGTCAVTFKKFTPRVEIKNQTANGYDIYLYEAYHTSGITRIQFPTWTTTGGQDDIQPSWQTNSVASGTDLGNYTYLYHVDIADHKNQGGNYITHIYAYNKDGTYGMIASTATLVKAAGYVSSLYLTQEQGTFNNDKSYTLNSGQLYTNFTIEFDAKPTKSISIYSQGAAASTGGTHNYIFAEPHGGNTANAGIGLSIGTNGVMAVAHRSNYYYSLLSYTTTLTDQKRYKFVVQNNIPYLYINDVLVATGVSPVSPVTTLYTNGAVGAGSYGKYQGYANNFVIYNTAKR